MGSTGTCGTWITSAWIRIAWMHRYSLRGTGALSTLSIASSVATVAISCKEPLWNGFAASVVSLLFLFVIAVAVTFEEERSWKAEPIAAIVLATVTIGQGTRLIYYHSFDIEERLRTDARA